LADDRWPVATPTASLELAAHFTPNSLRLLVSRPPERAVFCRWRRAATSAAKGVLIVGLNSVPALTTTNTAASSSWSPGQITAAIANAEATRKNPAKAGKPRRRSTAPRPLFFCQHQPEFRTPLTLMLGPLEDRLDKSAHRPGEEVDWIRVVHRNGLRLLRLVNTLLDFVAPRAGRAQAVFRPLDLSALTPSLRATFAPRRTRLAWVLTVDCPPLDEPRFHRC